MRNWPVWIPSPNSWMSAILLILLVRGIAVVIRIIFQMGESLIEISPKLRILLFFAALLSPILVISFAHHLLHLFLDRYFPNTRSPDMTRPEGLLPSLMSWWEGLYSWMTIGLAMIASGIVKIISLPSFNYLYDTLALWDELRDLFTIYTLIRIVTVAYLYQFEHLVRYHLMSVGSATQYNQQ